MALWLVRAGSHGEHETRFLEEKRVYLTWDGRKPAVHIFAPDLPNPYFHYRTVKWVGEDRPRSTFAQDLLYSFGAFMTICRIQRNQAEERVRAMAHNHWKPEGRTGGGERGRRSGRSRAVGKRSDGI